ncbi:MAG: type II toxin-antitoxin system VapB family antitoxin [Gemmatimonadales bacterium]
MRTTVRLDATLLRQAKRRAAETGRTLTALIEEGLRTILGRPPVGASPGPGDLPTSGTGGVRPGVDLDNSAALYDLMEAGR